MTRERCVKRLLLSLLTLSSFRPARAAETPPAATPSAPPPALTPGVHVRTLPFAGEDRSYRLFVPSSYSGDAPFPVVLAFHGGGANAEVMARYSGLDRKAEAAGFLAVYPDGTSLVTSLLTWNAGDCCGYARRENVDDVGFVRAVLDDLAQAARVDPARVYATGMSNGAMMAYRLACELPDRIAAIAPVAGPLAIAPGECRPSRAVPVVHFHGTDDRFAPYRGGRGDRSLTRTRFRSVEASLAVFRKLHRLRGPGHEDRLPDREGDDGTQVVRTTWGGDRGDGASAPVILYTVEGGGHAWPGQDPRLPALGRSTRDVSANDVMWEFFALHPIAPMASTPPADPRRPAPPAERRRSVSAPDEH